MGIRNDQKEQRRADIIAAVLDLFVKKGYSATKIIDIAYAANMSPGLLFHYFKSKEKLYEEIVRYGLEGTKMPMQITDKEPFDVFMSFAEMLFSYAKENHDVAKMFVLMAQAQQSDATPPHIREIAMNVNTIEASVSLIERGQKDGTIRKGNPYALSAAFWSSIQGIMETYASNPDMPLPEAEWICGILKEN